LARDSAASREHYRDWTLAWVTRRGEARRSHRRAALRPERAGSSEDGDDNESPREQPTPHRGDRTPES